MTKIPGIKAVHAIITPKCRTNRGNQSALHEAFSRIEREYSAILSARNDGFVCHVALMVEDVPSVGLSPESDGAGGVSLPKSGSGSAAARPATHVPNFDPDQPGELHCEKCYRQAFLTVEIKGDHCTKCGYRPLAPSVGAVEQKTSGEKKPDE